MPDSSRGKSDPFLVACNFLQIGVKMDKLPLIFVSDMALSRYGCHGNLLSDRSFRDTMTGLGFVLSDPIDIKVVSSPVPGTFFYQGGGVECYIKSLSEERR